VNRVSTRPGSAARCRQSLIRQVIAPRVPAAGAGILALSAGLACRYGLAGFWAKYLGVAFWATVLYALILFVKPSLGISRVAALTLAISWFVEFAQLTPVPARISSLHLVLRLILGTTFNVGDLPACAAGVGLAAGAHTVVRLRCWRAPGSQYHESPKGREQ